MLLRASACSEATMQDGDSVDFWPTAIGRNQWVYRRFALIRAGVTLFE